MILYVILLLLLSYIYYQQPNDVILVAISLFSIIFHYHEKQAKDYLSILFLLFFIGSGISLSLGLDFTALGVLSFTVFATIVLISLLDYMRNKK